jgi:hypothetical protein
MKVLWLHLPKQRQHLAADVHVSALNVNAQIGMSGGDDDVDEDDSGGGGGDDVDGENDDMRVDKEADRHALVIPFFHNQRKSDPATNVTSRVPQAACGVLHARRVQLVQRVLHTPLQQLAYDNQKKPGRHVSSRSRERQQKRQKRQQHARFWNRSYICESGD